jgi:hypothetical protein
VAISTELSSPQKMAVRQNEADNFNQLQTISEPSPVKPQ